MGYTISRWEPFGVWLSEQEKLWAPLVDVEETQEEVIIRADLWPVPAGAAVAGGGGWKPRESGL